MNDTVLDAFELLFFIIFLGWGGAQLPGLQPALHHQKGGAQPHGDAPPPRDSLRGRVRRFLRHRYDT